MSVSAARSTTDRRCSACRRQRRSVVGLGDDVRQQRPVFPSDLLRCEFVQRQNTSLSPSLSRRRPFRCAFHGVVMLLVASSERRRFIPDLHADLQADRRHDRRCLPAPRKRTAISPRVSQLPSSLSILADSMEIVGLSGPVRRHDRGPRVCDDDGGRADRRARASTAFLDLPPPFHCISSDLHCLFTAFRSLDLPPPFHCLSSDFHCLSTAFRSARATSSSAGCTRCGGTPGTPGTCCRSSARTTLGERTVISFRCVSLAVQCL